MTDPSIETARDNKLLAMLSPAATSRIVSRMTRMRLTARTHLLVSGRGREAVYFPLDALAVLSHTDAYARTAGVALVGCDGVVGAGLLLGGQISIHDAHAVMEGDVLCMPRDAVVQELASDGEFRNLMLRYVHALLTQISYVAFCERIHSIEQRLVRWLLLARDRTSHDGLTFSQEALASVIGVRREGISVAAGKLQQAQLVRYQRGRIEIVDRRGMEALACQCYRGIRDEYARLFASMP